MKEIKKFVKGFGYAFEGIITALKTECNMRAFGRNVRVPGIWFICTFSFLHLISLK